MADFGVLFVVALAAATETLTPTPPAAIETDTAVTCAVMLPLSRRSIQPDSDTDRPGRPRCHCPAPLEHPRVRSRPRIDGRRPRGIRLQNVASDGSRDDHGVPAVIELQDSQPIVVRYQGENSPRSQESTEHIDEFVRG